MSHQDSTARSFQRTPQDIQQTAPSATFQQAPLPTGPLGIVSRGIPDNREFWRAVNTVKFTTRGATRTAVYRAVAYFASLTAERVCFASVATIAGRAALGAGGEATRRQLRALEVDGHIEAVGGRSGGRNTTRYRLILAVPNPTPTQRPALPTPTPRVAEVVHDEERSGGPPSGRRPPFGIRDGEPVRGHRRDAPEARPYGNRAAAGSTVEHEYPTNDTATCDRCGGGAVKVAGKWTCFKGCSPAADEAAEKFVAALKRQRHDQFVVEPDGKTGLVNGESTLTDEQETQARQRIAEQAAALGVVPEPVPAAEPVAIVYGLCESCGMMEVIKGQTCVTCSRKAAAPADGGVDPYAFRCACGEPDPGTVCPKCYRGNSLCRPSADWNAGGDP